MNDYNENEKSKHLLSFDTNNLYEWGITRYLPEKSV